MQGREETSDLTFDELEHLEKTLAVWIYHIRSTKARIVQIHFHTLFLVICYKLIFVV